jgi:hypothetical protein
MNAKELRALERLQADTLYLARLLERTMVEDADALQLASVPGSVPLLKEVRQLQIGLRWIHDYARQTQDRAVRS